MIQSAVPSRRLPIYLFAPIFAATLLAGCGRSQQMRHAETSGFLGDYSQMREGTGNEANLVFINPNADYTKYTKIIVDPVQVVPANKSKLSRVPAEKQAELATRLRDSLVAELAKDYQVVDQPAADTLRLRAAVTEARASKPVLDTITTIIPIGLAISTIKRMIVGSPSFVGDATGEAEILDSATNERLLAGVDRQVGTKVLRGKFRKWDDVHSAYNEWAKRIRERLAELKAAKAAPAK